MDKNDQNDERIQELNTKLISLRMELDRIGSELILLDRAQLTLSGLMQIDRDSIIKLEDIIAIQVESVKIKNVMLKLDNTTMLPMTLDEASKFIQNKKDILKNRYEQIEKELKDIESEIVKILKSMK
ncbi:MAG: hypothetical protein QW044_00980 [Candidatus Anstonellales archaeon]